MEPVRKGTVAVTFVQTIEEVHMTWEKNGNVENTIMKWVPSLTRIQNFLDGKQLTEKLN